MQSTHQNFLTCPVAPELAAREERPFLPSESSRAPQPPRPPRRKWALKTLAIVLAFFVLSVAAGGAWLAQQISILTSSLGLAKTHLHSGAFESAQKDLAEARVALTRTQRLLTRQLLRKLPLIGTQVKALSEAMEAAMSAFDGGDVLLELLEAISPRSAQHLTREEKRQIVHAVAEKLPALRLARDKLDLATEIWTRASIRELAPFFRSRLEPLGNVLGLLKRSLSELVPLVEIGTAFAGEPHPLHALVLLQNSDELRPAGGFIGTIGAVTMNGGELTEFDFQDVYKIDNPVAFTWHVTPPKPMVDHLGVTSWFLRDANWSPDFPTSAETVLATYTRERELAEHKPLADPPSAVIALAPGFFTALLRFTGPVTVRSRTFDADTFFDRLEYEVESDFLKKGIPVERRKEIVAEVGAAIVKKLSATPASRWPEFLDLLTVALERKQVLLYTRDVEALQALDRVGWTGRAQTTNGDFLWVVDANLAAFKTDGVMDKSVSYELDAREPTRAMATVTLRYTNTNPRFTWRYTRYRSYTRVYVPEGSTLLESSGALRDDRYRTGGVATPGVVDVFQELGKTVFGAFWSIEPGQTGILKFRYQLPASTLSSLAENRYRLDWPKQLGADRTSFALDLQFPKKIQSASPPEHTDKFGDARYEYKIDSLVDRNFEIRLMGQ